MKISFENYESFINNYHIIIDYSKFIFWWNHNGTNLARVCDKEIYKTVSCIFILSF